MDSKTLTNSELIDRCNRCDRPLGMGAMISTDGSRIHVVCADLPPMQAEQPDEVVVPAEAGPLLCQVEGCTQRISGDRHKVCYIHYTPADQEC